MPSDLTIAAYLKREKANDVLISKDHQKLHEIRKNGIIATGSLRRSLQLLQYRNDLHIVDIRGNLDTRIEKLYKNDWDGIILAYAGLKRFGRTDLISEILSEKIMYPAVGQGIIAVECRDEPALRELFSAINDDETETCAVAERAFLEGLGGGCQVPVGVISHIEGDTLHLSGVYIPENGEYCLKENIVFEAAKPGIAGKKLAQKILNGYKERQENANG